MNMFQTLGLIWIILTSGLASIAIIVYVGIKPLASKEKDLPAEVGEKFKIVR